MQGKWTGSNSWNWIIDPLNGERFIKVAEVHEADIEVLTSMLISLLLSLIFFFLKRNELRFFHQYIPKQDLN